MLGCTRHTPSISNRKRVDAARTRTMCGDYAKILQVQMPPGAGVWMAEAYLEGGIWVEHPLQGKLYNVI